MDKQEVCSNIQGVGIVPAVRTSCADDARFAAETIFKNGIPIVEITMTVPGALDVISYLIEHLPKLIVGAGTLLDLDTAKKCADAGVHFLTSPGFDREIVEFAAERNLTAIPGALTPTEIITAWKAGADFVKVFPCAEVGGEHYIRALRGPLPDVRLIAAGGVNQQTAANFIRAGADALGVGRQLIPEDAIVHRKEEQIRELTRRFIGFVKTARSYKNAAHSTAH